MNTRLFPRLAGLAGTMLGICTLAPLHAAEFWVQARETTKVVATMAGSADSITMWEYALCGEAFAEPCAASAPGPILRVPAGDTQLIVHLQNNLTRAGEGIQLPHVAAYGGVAVPTSVLVPGLPAPGFASGAVAGDCPTGASGPVDSAGRIRSFTSEVPNGTSGTYCWSSVRPGSFVYQSGTHPAVQVQMGLYGALIVESAADGCTGPACAYPGVAYDQEVIAVFSEIDPRLHAAVGNGSYGDPNAGTALTSTIFYEPQYFFIDGAANGVPFTSLSTVTAGASGERVLLRLINAGIENHAPVLQGAHFSVVAEDANPYNAALASHSQYSVLLPAAKTIDAMLETSSAGTFPLYDRRRMSANAAEATVVSGVTAVASGMVFRLTLAPSAPVAAVAAEPSTSARSGPRAPSTPPASSGMEGASQ